MRRTMVALVVVLLVGQAAPAGAQTLRKERLYERVACLTDAKTGRIFTCL